MQQLHPSSFLSTKDIITVPNPGKKIFKIKQTMATDSVTSPESPLQQ